MSAAAYLGLYSLGLLSAILLYVPVNEVGDVLGTQRRRSTTRRSRSPPYLPR